MKKSNVIRSAVSAHTKRFGVAPTSTAWAPGRIEVLGNHTDYNEGTVFSAAIDLGHCFCLSPSDTPGIRLLAVDVNKVASFEVKDISKVPGYNWANYVKGSFYFIQERIGKAIDGLDCTFFGSIPMGAGLSSSAALEIAASYAVLHHLDVDLDRKDIAVLARRAEHEFAGTNCGLLDQFSSIFGREHGLIHSDFRTLDVTSVGLPADISFLVVNPHVKHSLSESPYNERRERCEQAAAQLAALLPHPVKALRDVSPEEFKQLREQIDPAAAKRAAHIIGEINRVERGVEYLKQWNIEGFGSLLYASHQSSIEHFENSCAELDIVVEAARHAGAPGARLSGGGFGGSAIVLVYDENADDISAGIMDYCRAKGLNPDILTVTPSAGAAII
jgi:galactokinase